MRAFVSNWAERLPLRINSSSWARSSALNRTTYFLTAITFPTTNHLHRSLTATEIQKLPSFSMTGATSKRLGRRWSVSVLAGLWGRLRRRPLYDRLKGGTLLGEITRL